MFRRYMSFRLYRTYVHTIFVAILVIIVVLPCMLYAAMSSNLIRESNDASISTLTRVSRAVEIFFGNAYSVAVQLACNEPNINTMMFQSLPDRIREYTGMQAMRRMQATYSYIDYIAVYNQRMNRLVSTSGLLPQSEAALIDLVHSAYQTDYYPEPMTVELVGNAGRARRNTVTILIYSPLSNENDKGALLMGVDCDYMQQLIREIDSSTDQVIVIYDAEGNVVSHPSDQMVLGGEEAPAHITDILAQSNQTGSMINGSGKERTLVAYSGMPSLNWVITSSIPYESALRGVRFLRNVILAMIGLAVLIGITYTWLAAKLAFRPMEDLLSRYDYNPKGKPSENDELGFLGERIDGLEMDARRNQPLIREAMLLSLLHGHWSEDEPELVLHQFFPAGFYLVSLIRLDNRGQLLALAHQEQVSTHYVIQEILAKRLEPFCLSSAVATLSACDLALVLRLSDGCVPTPLPDALLDACEIVQGAISMTITTSLGTVVDDIHSLPDSLESARDLMKQRFFAGYGTVLSVDRSSSDVDWERQIPELEQALWRALQSGDKGKIDSAVDELAILLSQADYEYFFLYITQVINGILASYLTVCHGADATEFHDLMHRIRELDLMEQVIRHIRAFFRDIGGRIAPRTGDCSQLVRQAKDLAARHYVDASFSLNTAAEALSLSPTYCNRIFKKEVGIAYSEYINAIRLRRAALLLRSGEMPVSDICDRIGIANTSYFYTLFKKAYGVTPQQYRKMGGTDEPAPLSAPVEVLK